MPAMNAAISPAMAMPSMPLGRRSRMRSRMESLNSTPSAASPAFNAWVSATETPAIMPGITTMKGTNILGNAPMMGALRAEFMLLEAIARWTSTKLVVQ
jgi:hypothetical protein